MFNNINKYCLISFSQACTLMIRDSLIHWNSDRKLIAHPHRYMVILFNH